MNTVDSPNKSSALSSNSEEEIITVAIVSDTHSYLDPRIEKIVAESDYAVHAGDICFSDEVLPETLRFNIAGQTIAVEHGHQHGSQPSHESLRKAHPNAKVVVYGHTHRQVIDKDAMPWVINPGAAGKTRTHGGPSCLVIECSKTFEWKINVFRFADL